MNEFIFADLEHLEHLGTYRRPTCADEASICGRCSKCSKSLPADREQASSRGRTTVLLLQASVRACDHWRDGPEARAMMRAEVLAVPPEQQVELLEHFQAEYGDALPEPANEPSATGTTARTCRACAHRLRAGTCSEPVEAGLAEAFMVVWPPVGHGVTCPAFQRVGEVQA